MILRTATEEICRPSPIFPWEIFHWFFPSICQHTGDPLDMFYGFHFLYQIPITITCYSPVWKAFFLFLKKKEKSLFSSGSCCLSGIETNVTITLLLSNFFWLRSVRDRAAQRILPDTHTQTQLSYEDKKVALRSRLSCILRGIITFPWDTLINYS